MHNNLLKESWLDTPLGPMLAIADGKALYLLEFADRRGLEGELERLKVRTKSAIVSGQTSPIVSIKNELASYFEGNLQEFKTPFSVCGSLFQKKVWEQLRSIPYGQTRSYLGQATAIKQPSASRAVANANGANQLAIVIPCHRIIRSTGEIGGYGGGLARKKWLLEHEKRNA